MIVVNRPLSADESNSVIRKSKELDQYRVQFHAAMEQYYKDLSAWNDSGRPEGQCPDRPSYNPPHLREDKFEAWLKEAKARLSRI